MNKPLVRALLRGGLFFLDALDLGRKTTRQVSRTARNVMQAKTSEPDRKALSFTVGIGVGLALGILFAPATGERTRVAILQNARELRNRLWEKRWQDKKPAARTNPVSSGLEQREGI